MVNDCVTTQWFRYGYGRTESPEQDACSMAQLRERFAAGGFDIKELLVALTQTDVAETLSVSQKRISEIERGQVDFTKVDTLRRYADALGGSLKVEVTVGDETYQIA